MFDDIVIKNVFLILHEAVGLHQPPRTTLTLPNLAERCRPLPPPIYDSTLTQTCNFLQFTHLHKSPTDLGKLSCLCCKQV